MWSKYFQYFKGYGDLMFKFGHIWRHGCLRSSLFTHYANVCKCELYNNLSKKSLTVDNKATRVEKICIACMSKVSKFNIISSNWKLPFVSNVQMIWISCCIEHVCNVVHWAELFNGDVPEKSLSKMETPLGGLYFQSGATEKVVLKICPCIKM